MKHDLFFAIKPEPQRRARIVRNKGFTRGIKTEAQESYEVHLGKLMHVKWRKKPLENPLSIKLVFFMPIPASYSKKKKALALKNETPYTKTPDLSNLIKNVEDVGNGILWLDDKQIYSITAEKRYGQSVGIILEIQET